MVCVSSMGDLSSHTWIDTYLSGRPGMGGLMPETALRCAIRCADEAGEMIRKSLLERREVNTKCSVADLVTATDVAVEKAIRERISLTFPSHLFVGEETTAAGSVTDEDRGTNFVWIVDPIDGTTNFVHGFPIVTVSIALAYRDELVMGVVYNPMTSEAWLAWKGCGAYMKRASGSIVPIHTSRCDNLGSALVSTGFAVAFLRRKCAAVEAQQQLLEIVEHNTRVLMTQARDIRRIGSAACDLCFVAMGRTDCFFEFGVREWDIAAGLVILHEAGGESSTVTGKQPCAVRGRNVLVAATRELRSELNRVLKDTNAVGLIEAVEA